MAEEKKIELPEQPLASPSVNNASLRYSYTIGRGETGVLTFEPYKSLILPFWAFKTEAIASNSSSALFSFSPHIVIVMISLAPI